MITPSDLICLPYTPDLNEGGIAYACRWLACTYGRWVIRRPTGCGGWPARWRWNWHSGIIFPGKPSRSLYATATPFSHPDHYDVALGGHRCDIISYLITRRSQIAQLRREPGSLLRAPALIPVDQFAADAHKPDDLYLFAFLTGAGSRRAGGYEEGQFHRSAGLSDPSAAGGPGPGHPHGYRWRSWR